MQDVYRGSALAKQRPSLRPHDYAAEGYADAKERLAEFVGMVDAAASRGRFRDGPADAVEDLEAWLDDWAEYTRLEGAAYESYWDGAQKLIAELTEERGY